jgi:hypothetical protein
VVAVSFQNIIKTGKSMLQGKFTDKHKKRDKAYNNGKKNAFYIGTIYTCYFATVDGF